MMSPRILKTCVAALAFFGRSRWSESVVMMRLALQVAYDGTPYRGWTDLRDTALRPALAKVLGCDDTPLLEAASRTDAGVHACGQVCSLALAETMDVDTGQLAYSLNQLLPPEIAIRRAALVGDDWSARANIGKTYIYRVCTRPGCRDPLTRLYEWHAPPRRGRSERRAAAVPPRGLRGRAARARTHVS